MVNEFGIAKKVAATIAETFDPFQPADLAVPTSVTPGACIARDGPPSSNH